MKQLLSRLSSHISYKTLITIFVVILVIFILFPSMRSFYFVMRLTLYSSIPLILVALGGLYSERSGVVNIALEGIMLLGAFVGIFTMYLLQARGVDGQWLFIFCIFLGGIVGAIYAVLHAYASVSMSANQIISGTALNLLAPAFAIFIARFITGTQQLNFNDEFRITRMGILSDLPLIGPILFTNVYISTFIGLGVFLIGTVVLYQTRFGLRLRACGEHPHAADAAGVNVAHIRYAGVIISGFLAGLGGVVLIVATTTTFNASVSGYGFLALAVLISGQWKPGRLFVIAILFGFLLKLSDAVILIPILNALKLPSLMYSMIPYIATLIVLAFTSKKSQAPRAVGEPYDVSKR